MDTSTIPNEEIGLRLAHAAGFLPSSYAIDNNGNSNGNGNGHSASEGLQGLQHLHRDFFEHSLEELTQTVSDYAAGQGLFGETLGEERLSPYQSPLRTSPRSSSTNRSLSMSGSLHNVSSDDNIGSNSVGHSHSRSLLTPVKHVAPEIDDPPSPSADAPPNDDSPFPLEGASMGPLLNGTWAFEGL